MAHPDTDSTLAYYGIGPEPDLPTAGELKERRERYDRIDELEDRVSDLEAQLAAAGLRIRPGFWPR